MSVHLGLLALLLWVGSVGRNEARASRGTLLRVALWGATLLAVPQVAIAGAGGRVSSLSEVLVFALVPAFVVFAVAQRATGFGPVESPLRSLSPALAGLGGLALLVPFTLPVGPAGAAWLCVLIGAAGLSGVAAVRLHGLLAGGALLRHAAVVGAAGAALGGVCSRLGDNGPADWSAAMVGTEAARCLLVDAPVLMLTVWLLREMPPVRFAAHYLLIPLVTVVEGFLLVRPQWSWTIAAGFLLLAAGCAGLLRSDSPEVQEEL